MTGHAARVWGRLTRPDVLDRKRAEFTGFALYPLVRMHEPMGFHDYNCLHSNAFCVISGSGTLLEESSFFASVGRPFPAVCMPPPRSTPRRL